MHIKNVVCPRCRGLVVVDGGLHDIGTIRLKCPSCGLYFLPPESPGTKTISEVTNASVEIRIWEPEVTE
jgi:hypothetical protein